MKKDFCFTDSIEVLMDNYDFILFTPVYSMELGLYLSTEDDKPIKQIVLLNSKLTVYYVDGMIRQSQNSVLSILVDDKFFKRRIKTGILGDLFKYSYDDATFYGLDVSKAFDYRARNNIIRKRSL